MPDYNSAVALGVKPPENNLAQTFNTIANIQQSQAHTGLYTLEEAKLARENDALAAAAAAYRANQDPTSVYLSHLGDPAKANQFQTLFAGQRAMAVTPGGLMPSDYERLQGAREKAAQTSNLGVQHGILQTEQAKKDMELRGSIAQSLAADTSDENWQANIQNLAGHVSKDGAARIMAAMRDPSQRASVAKSMIAAAIPTAEATAIHNISATEGTTTPLGELARSIPQAAAGAPAPTTGRAPMSPSAIEEQKQRGEYLGKLPGKLTEDANNAKQQNNILEQMKLESATWPMGKGAETLMSAGQFFKPIANAFGNHDFDKPIADYENFKKNAGSLLRTAVKEVSPRAAYQEFQLIGKQLPEPGMSRLGFYGIADQFQSVNDFKLAKEQAGSRWGRPVDQGGHGTMEGFEADWNKNISPTAFLVHRMSPEQLHQVAAGLQQSVEGRVLMRSIREQMQYAQKAGLF